MNKANVNLSQNEQLLVNNTEWILTKHGIIDKVYQLFGLLSDTEKHILNEYDQTLPDAVKYIAAKQYKGEQYLRLPYVLMDYPRYFTKHSSFAIRQFFWWGNYFSITLQLSGEMKLQYQQNIIAGYALFANDDWWISTTQDPWIHHIEANTYRLISGYHFEEWQQFIKHHPFIKIAKKIPLKKWDAAYDFFQMNFKTLLAAVLQ